MSFEFIPVVDIFRLKFNFMASDTSLVFGEHNGNSRKENKKLLVNALVIGEKSPRIENFDPKAHLKKLHDRKK
ncbi:MAG: hypothetical protein RLY89_40 [Bacteroidota bacterium]|jgi:hypothetical protein